MKINTFKRALAEKRAQIGIWMGLANPYSAEICAAAGFDWLLFDGEHAPNTVPTLLAQLQAVAPYPVHPVARPPIGETWLIKQYLDIGFQTLLLPLVANAGHAAELVRATRYPPTGTRGVGAALARASGWNRDRDYLAGADDEICVLLQVETAEALRDLDAIARTDGVDCVFIGPADLSASLGHRGNPGHPEVVEAIDGAIATILAAGKAPGILTADAAAGRRYLDQGCLFVGVGNDVGLLARAADGLASQFRGAPADAPAIHAAGPY
ncbi:MAG: 4-hydroxy-2-oxo-heptane,7-dioate aldolase [Alphaproteobacteria bacterium]|nr:4-hydroxy-2-oxo-heptane,7-dioate aldolase [Alphaproteobacteria bacterium]